MEIHTRSLAFDNALLRPIYTGFLRTGIKLKTKLEAQTQEVERVRKPNLLVGGLFVTNVRDGYSL